MALEAVPLIPVSLRNWIEGNRHGFQPPVSNKVIWSEGDFIAMVVRGPNARNDFHIDPYDEIFYQIEGTIAVDVIVDGKRERKIVREGELLLVPGGVPHGPMRPDGTWGLVIERARPADVFDELVWFCDRCGVEMRRERFHLN